MLKIRTYKPSSELLKKFIHSIYFLDRNEQDEPITYLTFPHIYTMVSLNLNTEVVTREGCAELLYNTEKPFTSTIAFEYKKPVLIHYSGPTTEITMSFQPLAMNYFIDHPLAHYANQQNSMVDFLPFPDYAESMTEILKMNTDQEKLQALEQYWLKKFRNFQHPFLIEFLKECLKKEHDEFKIAQAADQLQISQKTLIQHFKRYVGRTPSEFRKIVRFRKCLDLYDQPRGHKVNLSQLESYFDQSHMVKDFKAMTGYSPKRFFESISRETEDGPTWIFLS